MRAMTHAAEATHPILNPGKLSAAAAAAKSTADATTALMPPREFRTMITPREPVAAPKRSAKYKPPACATARSKA